MRFAGDREPVSDVGDGDVVRLEAAGPGGEPSVLELPTFVQPGLNGNVVAVVLGYGSVLSRRFANIGPPWLQARPTVGTDGLVGKNAAGMLSWLGGKPVLRSRRRAFNEDRPAAPVGLHAKLLQDHGARALGAAGSRNSAHHP